MSPMAKASAWPGMRQVGLDDDAARPPGGDAERRRRAGWPARRPPRRACARGAPRREPRCDARRRRPRCTASPRRTSTPRAASVSTGVPARRRAERGEEVVGHLDQHDARHADVEVRGSPCAARRRTARPGRRRPRPGRAAADDHERQGAVVDERPVGVGGLEPLEHVVAQRDGVGERVQRERVLGRAVDAEERSPSRRRPPRGGRMPRRRRRRRRSSPQRASPSRPRRPSPAGTTTLGWRWKMPRTAWATSAAFNPAVATW